MEKMDRVLRKGKHTYYNFKCKCGSIVIRRGDNKAKHCGEPECVFSDYNKHGKSNSRLYTIWSGMRDRCINGCHNSSATYKNRGITVTPDWSLFINFEKWALNNGYQDNLTIDRIDINGNYEPSNCQWITREENCRNQNRDGHGSAKAVLMTNILTGEYYSFISILEAARFILAVKPSSKEKSIANTIGTVLNNKYYKDNAYGFKFKYKE
jgi:hypothetical protein